MSDVLPPCPACASEFAYESGALLVCSMCAYEWAPGADDASVSGDASGGVVLDSVGNPLADGDTVTIVKSLKVKGAGGGGRQDRHQGARHPPHHGRRRRPRHRCEGARFRQMQLKSSVVKKVL